MAVSAKAYDTFVSKSLNKEIDWDSDTIKVMLCTSSYTPNQATHDYKDDVTNEITGTGYTAGGATLGSVTITDTSHVWALDGADTAWSSSTFSAAYAVIYDSTPGSDATRPLIAYVDFGGTVSVTASTFTITWNVGGVVAITVS